MCRWLAYSGTPVLLDELLYKPKYSLIDQSLHSRLGATTTNGDGFGVGWYGVGDTPALFHSMEPAWNDRNLQELARHTSSPLVFAHIRASTGTAVQQTNCHPFRHGRWLWMHNGAIRDFDRVKRDLRFAIDPELYAEIEGSTDSETFFYLALTFGLEEDPPKAVQEAVGFIEETGRRHDVEHPIQMTVATTDGESIWAFRYSSEGDSRSLYFSTDVRTLKMLYPDDVRLQMMGDEGRLVVSEPLGPSPEPGTRCRSRATASSSRARTRCTRSRRRKSPNESHAGDRDRRAGGFLRNRLRRRQWRWQRLVGDGVGRRSLLVDHDLDRLHLLHRRLAARRATSPRRSSGARPTTSRDATNDFADDVKALGPPDTDAGQQAQESLESLADDLEASTGRSTRRSRTPRAQARRLAAMSVVTEPFRRWGARSRRPSPSSNSWTPAASWRTPSTKRIHATS